MSRARGAIELLAPFDRAEMVQGLAEFSHLWVIFQFHHSAARGWRARVRPPRLGGNAYRGVYASRSPFRPNGLGLSVVELLEIVTRPVTRLHVGGLDMIDGTPVFDIKPYVPYTDAVPRARGGFAGSPPVPALRVAFAPQVQALQADEPELAAMIAEVIALDPRPAYRAAGPDGRDYGMRLGDREVRFRVEGNQATVTAVEEVPPEG